MSTKHATIREPSGERLGRLLAPVPYGATRFEVQRDADFRNGTACHAVAVFHEHKEAHAYVALEAERDRLRSLVGELVGILEADANAFALQALRDASDSAMVEGWHKLMRQARAALEKARKV
jgi:hypothetical protein